MPAFDARPRDGRGTLPTRLFFLAAFLLGAFPLPGRADPAADLLNVARKAYNEKNFPFAADRFREFLGKYANHPQVPQARYGLALALLDGPAPDEKAALPLLKPLAADPHFSERHFALYYLGRACRGLGIKELAQTTGPETARHQAAARGHFEDAARDFEEAARAFAGRAGKPDPRSKTLPLKWEWSARARCDQAEMRLRLAQPGEARKATAGFLKDPVLIRSRYRGLGLYYHGFACFLGKDYLAAGRSLELLQPFTSTAYATHARYLLARVLHLEDERAEAGAHYEGVLADYERFKKEAAEALRHPEKFKDDPWEKARLEALLRDPPPDHVARAAFFSGVLHYEAGRFGEAQTRFAAFRQIYARSGLRLEAQLREGFCQVHLRQFAEAVRTLQPLADSQPRLADRALLWIGRAQAGMADPNNPAAYLQGLKTALTTFARAAAKAGELEKSDPEARSRRAETLLEMADTQQLAHLYKEAAATYRRLLEENLLPRRGEELLERLATALHLAGDYAGSEKVCRNFREKYPRSPLLASVLFRAAENAGGTARDAEKDAKLPDREKTLARLQDEAARRYQEIIAKYPEFAHVSQARYALGLIHYRRGQFEKAREILEAIPVPDRTGDLALVSFVLADCLMHLAPARAEDALAAGKLQEQLQGAVELLEGFVASFPKGKQTPAALVKLGLCYQRLASLLVKPDERNKTLGSARAAYEKLLSQFPGHPLQPLAIFERARCQALAGDKQGAINEYRRFTNDPLKNSPLAPLAPLQIALLLREQNKAGEAVKVLEECRKQYEKALLADRERAGWVVLLRYYQGLALREAGQLGPAREVFEGLMAEFPDRPEALEAALRRGQCLKEEALRRIKVAETKLAQANLKPEDRQVARRDREEGRKALRQAAQYLAGQAGRIKEKQPEAEVRARLLYEAAWGFRELGEPDVETARAQYQALIEDFPDLSLSNEARLELAELVAGRGDNEAAIKILEEALDKEPPAELTARIRLRQGACYAAKKDYRSALVQFEAVAQDPKGPLLAQARFRAGECYIFLKEPAKAVALLTVFRDQQPFQNLPGLTELALLRLGQAYAALGQWDPSRQAYEQVVNRFGNSPWVPEARYGIGLAWQNQKQYDQAVNVYNQVVSATTAEPAARAQFQIGVCRLEQKRFEEAATAFLAVPFTYDYPEWSAAARCEAARALVALKKTDEARRHLRRVLKDHPKSKWAAVARKRLSRLEER